MNWKPDTFTLRMRWKKIRQILSFIAEGILLFVSLASLFTLVYQIGFDQLDRQEVLIQYYRNYLLLVFFIGISLRYTLRFQEIIQEKLWYIDIGLFLFLFTVLCSKVFFKEEMDLHFPYLGFLSNTHLISFLLCTLSIIHLSRQTFFLIQTKIRPQLLFLYSFILLILIGCGLLMLPSATVDNIHFIDALFTSTTSVCITGLTTLDIATTFTRTGHIIIITLAQIGGIGVMTFTSFFALSFMKNSSFSSQLVLKDILNEDKISGLFRILFNIIIVTLLIEGIGAYLIFREIKDTLPGTTIDHLFFSVFHSISAFCGAGMSTLPGGLSNPLIIKDYNLHVWVSLVIIMGGIGFPIVFNYLKFLRHLFINGVKMAFGIQKRYIHIPRIINLQTNIVVFSTLALIVVGFVFYLIFEYNNTLADLPLNGKITDAFFGAVTPRTAGLSIQETTSLAPPTLILTLIWMMIGGGPMSTAGGLKVTTVFIALLTTYSFLREKDKVEISKREIAPIAIRRAFSIIVLYFMIVGIAFSILSCTEKNATLFTLLFECVSALSTVGLSMGLTPTLTTVGKTVIIITMFVGRIGMVAFFASFWKVTKKKYYNYPVENILM